MKYIIVMGEGAWEPRILTTSVSVHRLNHISAVVVCFYEVATIAKIGCSIVLTILGLPNRLTSSLSGDKMLMLCMYTIAPH